MSPQAIAVARTALGLAQGVALYFLYQAYDAKTWPATDPLVFAPLLLVAAFVPLIVVAGAGNLRPGTLAIWTIAATVLCAGLAFYDMYRDPGDPAATALPRIIPGATLWAALAAGLFIRDSLVVAGEADQRFIARYPQHFDVAWKQGLQFVLAAGFTSLFWGLLWLGAELFRLIRIEFLIEVIKRPWFSIPVTALAFTFAIHITDVQAGIVRGTRTLTLTLLSWLLPVMTFFAVAFVVALPF